MDGRDGSVRLIKTADSRRRAGRAANSVDGKEIRRRRREKNAARLRRPRPRPSADLTIAFHHDILSYVCLQGKRDV